METKPLLYSWKINLLFKNEDIWPIKRNDKHQNICLENLSLTTEMWRNSKLITFSIFPGSIYGNELRESLNNVISNEARQII